MSERQNHGKLTVAAQKQTAICPVAALLASKNPVAILARLTKTAAQKPFRRSPLYSAVP
jgi:hypothetical protein